MQNVHQQILKYFPEIIIIITIFTIALVYIILKQRKQELQSESTDNYEIDTNNVQNQDKTQQAETHKFTIIPPKREFDESIEVTKKSFSIFNDLNIIVADDNAINQKVITSLLADSPIKIYTADNGQEVFDILERHKDISIILMDAHMPVMDGFEASKKIREHKEYNNILVVALSGDTSTDDVNKMKLAGMQEHLKKPLQIDKMFKIFYMYANNIDVKNSKDDIVSSSINQEKGLLISSGDKDLYKQILLDFYTTYKNIDEYLSKNLISNNLRQSSAVLLDISGVAASIGAQRLSDLAKEYKAIIDNNQEVRYTQINHDFKTELDKVLTELQNLS